MHQSEHPEKNCQRRVHQERQGHHARDPQRAAERFHQPKNAGEGPDLRPPDDQRPRDRPRHVRHEARGRRRRAEQEEEDW